MQVRCPGYTGAMTIRVTTIKGYELLKPTKFSSSYSFDMTPFAVGMYVIEVINERTGEKVQKKVIKM